jgi:hypothetical protein
MEEEDDEEEEEEEDDDDEEEELDEVLKGPGDETEEVLEFFNVDGQGDRRERFFVVDISSSFNSSI